MEEAQLTATYSGHIDGIFKTLKAAFSTNKPVVLYNFSIRSGDIVSKSAPAYSVLIREPSAGEKYGLLFPILLKVGNSYQSAVIQLWVNELDNISYHN